MTAGGWWLPPPIRPRWRWAPPRHGARPGPRLLPGLRWPTRPRRLTRPRWTRWPPGACASAADRAHPPDGVWIDSTGCAHLHGGEADSSRTCWRACPRRVCARRPSPTRRAPRMRWRVSAPTPQPWCRRAPTSGRSRRCRSPPCACRRKPTPPAPPGFRPGRPLGRRPRAAGPPLRRRVALLLDQATGRVRAHRAGDARRNGGTPACLRGAAADRGGVRAVIDALLKRLCARLEAPARARDGSICCSSAWMARRRTSASAPPHPMPRRPSRAPAGRKAGGGRSGPRRGGDAVRRAARRSAGGAAVPGGALCRGRPATDMAPLVDRIVNRLGPGSVWRAARWKAMFRSGRSPWSRPSGACRQPPGHPACRVRCACSTRRSRSRRWRCCPTSRRCLHLARPAPPRPARRWARADLGRMVAAPR